MPYCPGCGYPHNHEYKNGYWICGWCKRKFVSGELLPKDVNPKTKGEHKIGASMRAIGRKHDISYFRTYPKQKDVIR